MFLIYEGSISLHLLFNRVYSQLGVNMVKQPKPSKERAEDPVHRADVTRVPDNNQVIHGNIDRVILENSGRSTPETTRNLSATAIERTDTERKRGIGVGRTCDQPPGLRVAAELSYLRLHTPQNEAKALTCIHLCLFKLLSNLFRWVYDRLCIQYVPWNNQVPRAPQLHDRIARLILRIV